MTHERFESPFHFDMALQEPVFYMERLGIKIDEKKRLEFQEEYAKNREIYQEDLNKVVGYPLNVNSPKQVIDWIYGRLDLPVRTKRGKLSSNEAKLRSLLAVCMENIDSPNTKWIRGAVGITLILKTRSVRKAESSYINVEFDKDHRARSTMSVGGTETGRFTSSKTLWGTGLNMQTVPRPLRVMFVADEGKELAEFDLNRGESWVYSHLSGDPEMIRIHEEGGDYHAETAAAISSAFGNPVGVDWVVANKHNDAYKIRYLGKKVNHASAYRMGEFKQAEVVNEEADDTGITITVSQARKSQQFWRQKYIGMPAWWDWIERELSNNRTLTTPYGRKRTFYGFWGVELFKEATAYVPQSTSVDYLDLGMLDVYHYLVVPGVSGLQLLHQNHDSILVQYDEGERENIIPAVIDALTRTLTITDIFGKTRELSIPIEASYGKSWGSLTEWDG